MPNIGTLLFHYGGFSIPLHIHLDVNEELVLHKHTHSFTRLYMMPLLNKAKHLTSFGYSLNVRSLKICNLGC